MSTEDILKRLKHIADLDENPSDELLTLFAQPQPSDFPKMSQVRSWTPSELKETVQTEITLREAGKLIVKARELRGMSTRELAGKVGVSQPRVVQIQSSGETLGIQTLVKFATALGFRVVIELVPEEGGEPIRAS
ncbi:helix-turn-helix domain-containing protein [Deinococcus misasensis]|uniref:helix-turn-helix domain-containing protein n=1 Tax=Deinococcus misasensis TaxID=392413 RepID=UPI0005502B80|nr:helix-turn-helix transcriptional regulator [Deinococcus misasensis]